MRPLILLAFLMTTQLAGTAQGGWVDLFNGKDLTGWKQLNGQAKYRVENGVLVGTTVPDQPNSFLVTEKAYGDFQLELDLKVDTAMNSGVQFRSESLPEHDNGRVFGYQMEVDPSPVPGAAGSMTRGVVFGSTAWSSIRPARKPSVMASGTTIVSSASATGCVPGSTIYPRPS